MVFAALRQILSDAPGELRTASVFAMHSAVHVPALQVPRTGTGPSLITHWLCGGRIRASRHFVACSIENIKRVTVCGRHHN